MSRASQLRLAVAVASLWVAPAVRAQTAVDPKFATAEELFVEGRRLMADGKPVEACARFAASQRLEPASGTVLNLARCYAQLGRTASAWLAYRQAALLSHEAGQAKREEVALAQADALAPQIPVLELRVAQAEALEDLVVTIDGEPCPSAAETRMPIDPGTHTLLAAAPHFAPFTVTFALKPSEARVVTVPALEMLQASGGGTRSAPPAPPRGDRAPMPPSSPTIPLRTVGFVVGGVGVAALGVGTVFALRTMSLNEQSLENDHCDAATGCDAYGLDLNESALQSGRAATVFLITGSVLVATGVTLYFLGDAERRTAPKTAHFIGLSAGVSTSGGGVVVRGAL